VTQLLPFIHSFIHRVLSTEYRREKKREREREREGEREECLVGLAALLFCSCGSLALPGG